MNVLWSEAISERGGDEAELQADGEQKQRSDDAELGEVEGETEAEQKRKQKQSREAETTRRRKTGRIPCDERGNARAGTRWESALPYRSARQPSARGDTRHAHGNQRETEMCASSASNAAHWSGSRARLHKGSTASACGA